MQPRRFERNHNSDHLPGAISFFRPREYVVEVASLERELMLSNKRKTAFLSGGLPMVNGLFGPLNRRFKIDFLKIDFLKIDF